MQLELTLFGPFVARYGGEDLPVRSRRGRAMLAMLALAPPAGLSRDRIAATLWPDRAEEQARASLRQELSSLRRALGPAGALLTADSGSIRLAPGALAQGFGDPAAGAFLDGLDLRSEPFEDWRRSEAVRLGETPVDARAADPAPDIFTNPAVLVTAFAPASEAAEDRAFATGLSLDLRTSLALWRWFPVIGPEAIGWRTDRDADLRALAEPVRAAYAIGGTILRAGARIRVSVSLSHVETGHLVWSETFDGEMSGIFEMQEAIGRAVVARVAPEIGRAEAARIQRRRPADLAAWQLVARTDELERTGGEGYGTPESNRAQVPLLEDAVRREPGYARAWARLGRFHFRSGLLGWSDDREASLNAALEITQRAVDLDPDEWEAQAYLALTLIFGRNELGPGIFHAREGVRLNPSAPIARHCLGCALEWRGEIEEALQQLRLVFDLNPNYPNRAAVLGDITTCELLAGRIEPAVEAARQLRNVAPNYGRGLQRVAITMAHAGEADIAREALGAALAMQPDFDADYVRRTYPYARPDHVEMVFEGLRRAGWQPE